MTKTFQVFLAALLGFAALCALSGCKSATDMPEIDTDATITIPASGQASATSEQSPAVSPATPSVSAPGAAFVSPDRPSPTETPAEPTIEPTVSAVYSAYYRILDAAVQAHGSGTVEALSGRPDIYRGVIHASLIDFDNDGLPELLYVYGDGDATPGVHFVVYGYTAGRVELVGVYQPEQSVFNVELLICRDGVAYIHAYSRLSYSAHDYYYTLVNGEWTLAHEFSWNAESSSWDHATSSFGNEQCLVNGEEVDKQAFDNASGAIDVVRTRVYWSGYSRFDLDSVGVILSELDGGVSTLPIPTETTIITYDEALSITVAWIDDHPDLTSYSVHDWGYSENEIPPPTFLLFGEKFYELYVSYSRSGDGSSMHSHFILVNADTCELMSQFIINTDSDYTTTIVESLDKWYDDWCAGGRASYPPARLSADEAFAVYNEWVTIHFDSDDYNVRRYPSGRFVIYGEQYYYFRADDDWKYYYNILVHMLTGELLFLQFEDGMFGGTYIEPLDDWYNRYFT